MTESTEKLKNLTEASIATTSLREKIVYSLRIRRPEFLIAAIPIAIIPAVLATGDLAQLLTAKFFAAFAIVQLIINYGDMINCYGDRDQDAVYKSSLSQAVYGLGLKQVRTQIALTALAISSLGLWLASSTGNCDIIVLVAIELVWAAQYSVPPFRLKGGGLFQVFTLIAIIFVIPMLIVYRTLDGPPESLAAIAVICGYGCALEGVIIVNTAEDYPEDLSFGVRTSVIAVGIERALKIATVMAAMGSIAVVGGLYKFGAGSAVVLPTICATVVVFVLCRLARAQKTRDEGDVQVVRKYARYVPHMLAALAWATTVSAMVGVMS